MSVNYKIVKRSNPRDLTLPKKYYASIVKGDNITFDELAQLISKIQPELWIGGCNVGNPRGGHRTQAHSR